MVLYYAALLSKVQYINCAVWKNTHTTLRCHKNESERNRKSEKKKSMKKATNMYQQKINQSIVVDMHNDNWRVNRLNEKKSIFLPHARQTSEYIVFVLFYSL